MSDSENEFNNYDVFEVAIPHGDQRHIVALNGLAAAYGWRVTEQKTDKPDQGIDENLIQCPEPLEFKLPVPSGNPLGELTLVLGAIKQLNTRTQELVDMARSSRATWADIGRAAGITRQSAYERWTEKGRQRNRENQRKLRTSKNSTD